MEAQKILFKLKKKTHSFMNPVVDVLLMRLPHDRLRTSTYILMIPC